MPKARAASSGPAPGCATGKHEFRVRGGDVYLTTSRVKSTLDFDIGRLYYISVEGAPKDAVLEWRILGSDWGPVSKYFLYPPAE
jgi:hypothetical protein